jgi:hypothetical protein
MNIRKSTADHEKIWVVSSPRLSRFAIDFPGMEKGPTTAREYRLSSMGHYLVSPASLNAPRRLVGCEIHWQRSRISRWLSSLRRLRGKKSADRRPPLSLIMDFSGQAASPFDAGLKRHIDLLYDSLRPLDSFFQTLQGIRPDQVSRVVGICEDEAGFRAPVRIEGAPGKQLDFIHRHAGQPIDVRFKQAHIADGLFEMKGFDFPQFDPGRTHRLIVFMHDGRPMACVLNKDHTVAFWLNTVKLVNYLQLFEYCIKHDPKMRQTLIRCVQGKATALRLMINPRLAIDYSRAPLPAIFQEVMGRNRPAEVSDRLIKQNLNLHQVGVSFNAITLEESGRQELRTHISVLQNLRALEPIKAQLPELFAEMDKRAAQSEAGKYYLLESICGARHDG